MNVTINGQRVVQEPSVQLTQATLALLSPTAADLQVSLRDRIEAFEELCKGHPQLHIPVKHKFIDGLYRREVTFPKHFVGSGKVHKLSHMDEMITGKMLVATEDGIKLLVAPCSMVTVPGHKKFGIALEPTTWVTFHPTKCTTVEEVEKEIMCDTWLDFELSTEYKDITDAILAREDYCSMLDELGITESLVREQSECCADRVHYRADATELKRSVIEGLGIFTTKSLRKGEQFLARTEDGLRTDYGRYTNHSGRPNCAMVRRGNSIFLETITSVEAGAELTCDYRVSVSVAKEFSCQV